MTEKAGIKGWCPGALRPMPSGDGLIVRLRLSAGELPLDLAAEIADWAQNYGNGAIDLSGRANLQLRGVSPAALAALTARLAARGLIDANAEAEAVRNVLVSPFAGLDPDAPMDVRPVARALEAELARNAGLWRLPGKFGFSFDAGAYPLGEARPDVAFEAIDAGRFAVRLGGAMEAPLGPVDRDDAVAAAVEIAHAFLALRETPPPPRRMRDAIRTVGLAAFAARAGLAPLPASGAPAARPLADLVGRHSAGGRAFVGAALPFGRIDAAGLRAFARAAAAAGADSLRLTPWRVIVAPCRADADLAAALADHGLILDPADPRLKIAACPGAPACSSAGADTRADALRLAPLFAGFPGAAPVLHLSGCAKGCAHPLPTRFAAVSENGAYDLVLDGKPGDAPAARGLSPAALEGMLRAHITIQQGAQ